MSELPSMVLKPRCFVHDYSSIPDWILLRGGAGVELDSTLDFMAIPTEGEDLISNTILARVNEMDGSESSQHHLEEMLAQPWKIPAELQPYYLLATGTQWKDRDGHHLVPYLFFQEFRWVMSLLRLDGLRCPARVRVVRVHLPGS